MTLTICSVCIILLTLIIILSFFLCLPLLLFDYFDIYTNRQNNNDLKDDK